MVTMDCKASLKKSNRATLGAIAITTFVLLNLTFNGKYDGMADFGIKLLCRRQLPRPPILVPLLTMIPRTTRS